MAKREAQIQAEHSRLDEAIKRLVETIREDQRAVELHQEAIREAKEELSLLLTQRGSNWADDAGYARLASQGKRTYYDGDGLDELIITDLLRYGWLKDYRREAVVPGRVQAK